MITRRFIIALVLMLLVGELRASGNEFKPSKSDANIHKIGHRHIDKGTDFYSLKKEKVLGKQLAQQVDRSANFVDDPQITRYVDQLGQSIARNSDVRMAVTFRVIDSDKINAFTLPGGYQYIDRGLLLQLKSEAELAGVLAYGIAHTALRSATKEATRADIARMAAISTRTFPADGWPRGWPMINGARFMIPLADLNFSQQDELAADYFGLEYVYVAGYDPECYVELVKRIEPQVFPASGAFGTSPPLPERVAAMRKEISRILPKRSDAVVSTPAFTEFQKRVRAWKSGKAGEHHQTPQSVNRTFARAEKKRIISLATFSGHPRP
jgi:beta-barrel assembly-enhancing protease